MLKGTKVFAWLGTTLLLFTLSFIYTPATADTARAKGEGIEVILFTDTCTSEKVAKAHPDKEIKKGSKAIVTLKGKILEACWIAFPDDGLVLLIDETGDEGTLPIEAFHIDPAI